MTFKQCSNCGCMKNITEGDVCKSCAKEIEQKLKSLQGICKNDIVENKFTDEELFEKYDREDMFKKLGISEPEEVKSIEITDEFNAMISKNSKLLKSLSK